LPRSSAARRPAFANDTTSQLAPGLVFLVNENRLDGHEDLSISPDKVDVLTISPTRATPTTMCSSLSRCPT